jgi:hypothetical protein
MDDQQPRIVAFDTTQNPFSEMSRQLGRIASALGTTSDKLLVMDYDWFPKEYMGSKYRDKILETLGSLHGLPHIQSSRQNGTAKIGYGIYIYKSFLDEDLKYALYCVKGSSWDEHYMVIEKGNLFKLKRNAIRLNKKASSDLKAPVLEEGLLEEVVQNTIGFLLRAKEIEKYGVKIRRGMILGGPPGNGKTMLCRYIQKMCSLNGIRWGVVTSADIDQAYADKQLTELFQRWTVTFFDDIDVGYMDRSKGNGKMACSLLTAMDGMFEGGHLVRIFTTNEEVKELDKAFTRPGRIDKITSLLKPEYDLRLQLIKTWPKEILDAIDDESCASRSEDYSFAEVEAIRSYLVTNKVLGGGEWDLEAAFDEFKDRREEDEAIRSLGFGKEGKKKKKRRKSKTGKDIIRDIHKLVGTESPIAPPTQPAQATENAEGGRPVGF